MLTFLFGNDGEFGHFHFANSKGVFLSMIRGTC